MKVHVDAEKCMGHGMCAALVSELFQVNDESGFNEMGEFEISSEQEAAALRGVSACPERAITVLNDVRA
jgi:ferredoxin